MATLQDVSGANSAFVNANSELQVALAKILANAGYAVGTGEAHDGSSGAAALRRSIYASPEKRLAVGMESLLWDDVFHHTVLNSRKYWNSAATMTTVVGSGFLTLNSGASLAAGAADSIRTYRSFPVLGNYPVTADFWFSLALVPQAQNIIEIGLGIPNATNTSPPTDGVYMMIDASGALQLVANYNGVSTTSGAVVLPAGLVWTANRVYHGELVCHSDRIELYFDTILIATVPRSGANTVGAMAQNQSGNLFARLYNAAATTGAQKLNIARWAVTLGDGNFNRSWGAARTGLGDHLMSAPDGQAVAQLDNIVNSAAPVSATLSNTSAGYTTPGGNFQFVTFVGQETDTIIFGYQVPAAAAGVPGKNYIVTGIEIDAWNMGAAVATTPTLFNWYVGIGSTAVSLATTDSAISRAPHRKFLGAQGWPIGAAIGARADNKVSVDFSAAPLIVEPGTFLHIIMRSPVGTATASQIIRGGCGVKGYFE